MSLPRISVCFRQQISCQNLIEALVFVHPENLLEVKTYILRRLPMLIYNPQTSKNAEGFRQDPTITSLYFDNPSFSLYTRKVEKSAGASSLRLRWYGHLADGPEILLEKKVLKDDESSEEIRIPIKDKYVMPFMMGDYKLEKQVQKLRDRNGADSDEVREMEKNLNDIQGFLRGNNLQPVVRANYTRAAFQIPGDDKVRVSIDTNLSLIREDALDTDRPCRDPEEWHRRDIDDTRMEFPFTNIKKGEISRFPYAVLEIKVRNGSRKRATEWVEELRSSHLVKETPRFSKFVHGVASLFEDQINTLPFWLSFLETDIRKDPEVAFQEEQDKMAKRAADEFAVGSFMGGKSASSFQPATASPSGKGVGLSRHESHTNRASFHDTTIKTKLDDQNLIEDDDSDDDGHQADRHRATSTTQNGLRSLFPSFSTSKYARAHRQDKVQLPPGVREPGKLIKDMGPVKVEPKVWLANQRYAYSYPKSLHYLTRLTGPSSNGCMSLYSSLPYR